VTGPPDHSIDAAAIAAGLRAAIGAERVSTGESERRLHGEDLSLHPRRDPDVVAYPESDDDVAAVLAWAHERRVPVVPFGAGTSLEGHVIPVAGGISLDLTRMCRVVALRPSELTATVQAGVTRSALEKAAAEHGLFFPVDPGADATLGGMAATNAAGTMTFRHGKMRSRILELTAVLPDGRRIRTGSRALKTSAGYDLSGLLIGSEGTLGVITELTVRLEGIPERAVAVRASFASVDAAAAATQAIVASGTPARRVELMDAWEVEAVNAFAGLDLPPAPLLIVEVAGSEQAAGEARAELDDLLTEHGAADRAWETTPAGQRALWRIRHDVLFAERLRAPGRESVSTDVCVPLDELGEALAATRAALERHQLVGGIVCHAGDGNIHAGVLVDVADAAELGRLQAFLDAIAEDARARGGTCTGEHGIGCGKRAALAREHPDLLDVMWAIKRVFDPHLIMNPGKVLPPPELRAPRR
jgi:D-lactate dehydrogenase (cytochrome)